MPTTAPPFGLPRGIGCADPLRGANIGCADPLRGANIGCADVPTAVGEEENVLPSPSQGRGAGGRGDSGAPW